MSQTSMPIICIMGPTCSGKTDLALALTQHFPCEIISVDSALVYRGMNIGTAKPSAAILKSIPHHLIDICDPATPYSAAQFCEDAQQIIHELQARHIIPLLVGGTMLYFRALQQGLSKMPAADPTVRATIAAQAAEVGWSALHAELTKHDPRAAASIKPTDPQRISRALEVFYMTGQPLSEWWQQDDNAQQAMLNIGLIPQDRENLRQRIATRFDAMLADGFVEEVRTLYQRGDLSPNLPALKAVGYRQVWQYLVGEIDFATMREQAITSTRQLAKRQLTWLRRWPQLHRLSSDSPHLTADALALLKQFDVSY